MSRFIIFYILVFCLLNIGVAEGGEQQVLPRRCTEWVSASVSYEERGKTYEMKGIVCGMSEYGPVNGYVHTFNCNHQGKKMKIPFSKIKSMYRIGQSRHGGIFKVINKENREFTVEDVRFHRFNGSTGYFSWCFTDEITGDLHCMEVAEGKIQSIVVKGESGKMKYNPKTGKFYPPEYQYDPKTGDKLIFKTRE